MIISIDYKGKVGSLYKCDMCSKKLRGYDVFRVYTSERGTYSALKKWDLCEKCYGYLNRYVENVKQKFIERRREKKNENVQGRQENEEKQADDFDEEAT